jgi:hypothetical protein
VDIPAFERALAELTLDDIRSIARDLSDSMTTTAEEIAATRAVLTIEHTLRRTHRLHLAAAVSLQTATTVQDVAARAHVELPDADVTRVARSAVRLARGLLADGPRVPEALQVLARGWTRLPAHASFAA